MARCATHCFKPSRHGLLAVVAFANACATQPSPQAPSEPPAVRVEPSATTPVFAFEDPGTIVAESEQLCARSEESGKQAVVEIPTSFDLPDYANAASVLLNGWRLRYLEGDNHVRRVRAEIDEVTVDQGAINWLARGSISDKNFDNPYEFCYTYTVIGWNGDLLDAASNNQTFEDTTLFDYSNTTALLALSREVEAPFLAGQDTVTRLPRGFALTFANQTQTFPTACFDCPRAHHILQLAYNMDHNEAIVDVASGEDRIDPEHAAWESYGILKDNKRRRDVILNESVALLAGNDIGVIRPPYTVLPVEDHDEFFTTCVSGDAEEGPETAEFIVEDVPFDYAMPMLTGWDIEYHCDAQHVRDVGTWLESFEYDKAPDAPTGTLRYTVASVLDDKAGGPAFSSGHKVTILGLNGREPTDLVPTSQSQQFCEKDPQGRLLVTVANVGADDAPASSARVEFAGGGTADVPAPPIAQDFAATLDPISIPPSCSGDCSFNIRVDADDDVVETDETNNAADGVCIG